MDELHASSDDLQLDRGRVAATHTHTHRVMEGKWMLIAAACPHNLAGVRAASITEPRPPKSAPPAHSATKSQQRPAPTTDSGGRVRSRRPESTAVMAVLVSGIMGGGATGEGCGNRLKGKSVGEEDVCGRKSPLRVSDFLFCWTTTVLFYLQTLSSWVEQTFHVQSGGCFTTAANA